MRRTFTPVVLFAAALTLGTSLSFEASAESAGSDRDQAREAFLRGVELVNQERWEEAREAFDRSLELYPTQTALFNRALCYGLLGRPAEAVRDLEEHLRLYDEAVDEERREEVRTELARVRDRIAHIEVRVQGVESATVLLDGAVVGQAPLSEPLRVNPGRHQVSVQAEGLAPVSRWVTVRAGDEAAVVLALERAGAVTGSIQVIADVDGATVRLDGAVAGRTPLSEPLTATEGAHVLLLEADGYAPWRNEVEVAAHEEAAVTVAMRPLEGGEARGRRRGGLWVGGWITAGTAVASLGAALALFLWNDSQFEQWESENAAIHEALASTDPTDDEGLEGRVSANNELSDSIRTVDGVTWGLLGLGAASAAATVILFILHARQGSEAGEAAADHRLSIAPTLGGFSLSARW